MTVTIAGGTKIEWADFTFNPWWGCAEVSPGCAHCYARTWAAFTRAGLGLWPQKGAAGEGQQHAVMITTTANWRKPLKWAREAPAQLGRRPRVFCASMADVFEDLPELDTPTMRHYRGEYPTSPRAALLDLIVDTPELDWLLLTKRPEFARDWLSQWYGRDPGPYDPEADTGILPNLWIGVSIENSRYTWRADVLREIPAAVKFISAEPLLGSLLADSNRGMPRDEDFIRGIRKPLDLTGIHWVIAGGESGPKSRAAELGWMLELVEACDTAGAAPFVKQLGARLGRDLGAGSKGEELDRFPVELQRREFPTTYELEAV